MKSLQKHINYKFPTYVEKNDPSFKVTENFLVRVFYMSTVFDVLIMKKNQNYNSTKNEILDRV